MRGRSRSGTRFPRPRGDGPCLFWRREQLQQVSPPTRGWTSEMSEAWIQVAGFPAHAGMDHHQLVVLRQLVGFPRPRGDGPRRASARPLNPAVSPPTRGWTRIGAALLPDGGGFPAHAGMDPCWSAGRSSRARFPRPRGDGPPDAMAANAASVVSPPTRGWTPVHPIRVFDGRGFPAHAGMDRLRLAGAVPHHGFPRPRGDGPCQSGRRPFGGRVSPPTRGWTPYHGDGLSSSVGFPAHAGMDPVAPDRGCTTRRFPRPRGDGPYSPDTILCHPTVSPPTRGWTLARRTRGRKYGGFPAHAGMDPRPVRRPTRCARFPRPRGDGPSRRRRRPDPRRVSPPTRGWTPPGRDAPRVQAGFPAHAGMDRRKCPASGR